MAGFRGGAAVWRGSSSDGYMSRCVPGMAVHLFALFESKALRAPVAYLHLSPLLGHKLLTAACSCYLLRPF